MTKKREKPARVFTRRQLSRWQREKKRQRIIFSTGIFIIVAVLCIVGIGWYINQYRPLHQTVIRVNDTEFDMNYYIKMLKYYGEGMPATYMYSLAGEVVKVIEQNEIVKQGAMELGVSVSDSEVDNKLNSNNPPLSRDYRDVVRTQLLVNKLLDGYFNQQVPLSTAQRQVMAMLLESKNQATEVSTRLEDGEDFGKLAGELSLESLSKTKKGDLGWQARDILAELLATSIPVEYAFSTEVGVLSQPIYDGDVTKALGYWIVEVLERDENPEDAHVQVILLGNEEEARQAKNRLEAGEDFATLAKEFSQLDASKENGGDLGWLTSGMVSLAFDEFVFDGEVGILSEPIRDDTVVTTGGYWLLRVLDKDDNREISNDDRDSLKEVALNEWVSSLWYDPKNKIDDSYLDDEKMVWAIEKAMES